MNIINFITHSILFVVVLASSVAATTSSVVAAGASVGVVSLILYGMISAVGVRNVVENNVFILRFVVLL